MEGTVPGLLPRCSAPDCACAEFLSQYYRPAQCVHCYHAIDVHAEGWALETTAAPDALPHFVHAASGARLATRLAGEPEPEPAAEDGVRASAGGEEAGAVGGGAAPSKRLPFTRSVKLVSRAARINSSGVVRPLPSSRTLTATSVQPTDAQATVGAGAGPAVVSTPPPVSAIAVAPVHVVPVALVDIYALEPAVQPDASADTATASTTTAEPAAPEPAAPEPAVPEPVVTAAEASTAGAAPAAPAPELPVPATAEQVSTGSVPDAGVEASVIVPETAVVPLQPTLDESASPVEAVNQPTVKEEERAVPEVADTASAANVEGDATVPAVDVALAVVTEPAAMDASTGCVEAGQQAASTAENTNEPPAGAPSPGTDAGMKQAETKEAEAGEAVAFVDVPATVVEPAAQPAELVPDAQPVATIPPSTAAAGDAAVPTPVSPSSPTADREPLVSGLFKPSASLKFDEYLGALSGEPLAVDMSPYLAGARDSGSYMYGTWQQYASDLIVAREIVLTPFTIMCLAAHPSRPDFGALRWERSLLSLQHVSTHLVEVPLPPVGRRDPAAAPGRPGGLQRTRSSVFGKKLTQASDGKPVMTQTTAVSLIFRAETSDTRKLLRTTRAKVEVPALASLLQKRKRSDWRSSAPLGRLAWKKRYCQLRDDDIAYYAGLPESKPGGKSNLKLKGTLPLTKGWVEVAEVGRKSAVSPAAGAGAGAGAGATSTAAAERNSTFSFLSDVTSREHCFAVRTPTTAHVFQATSMQDCSAWVHGIALSAVIAPTHVEVTQTLVFADDVEADTFIQALLTQRNRLLAAMPRALAANFACDVDVDGADVLVPAPATFASGAESDDEDDGDELPSVGGALSTAAVGGPGTELSMMWQYIDDSGNEQGSFSHERMLAWAKAGHFRPEVQMRCVSPAFFGTHLTAGVSPAGIPTLFMPLSVLYPDHEDAFEDPAAWMPHYLAALPYALLAISASGMDNVNVEDIPAVVDTMRTAQMPAELSIFLDVYSQRVATTTADEPSIVTATSAAPAAAAPAAAAVDSTTNDAPAAVVHEATSNAPVAAPDAADATASDAPAVSASDAKTESGQE